MAGGVDQGDLRVAPVNGDRGTVDGDALLAFERIEVGRGVALVDVADLVLGPTEIEDAFRGRGLARIHVSDDANVTQFFDHGRYDRREVMKPPNRVLTETKQPVEAGNRFPSRWGQQSPWLLV